MLRESISLSPVVGGKILGVWGGKLEMKMLEGLLNGEFGTRLVRGRKRGG